MNIAFTCVNVEYACRELGDALLGSLHSIRSIAQEYRNREDDRTLVIVLTCPCCRRDGLLETENAVLVSPFKGIDPRGYEIRCADTYPPFRNPGRGEEAASIDDFLRSFRTAIDLALG